MVKAQQPGICVLQPADAAVVSDTETLRALCILRGNQ